MDIPEFMSTSCLSDRHKNKMTVTRVSFTHVSLPSLLPLPMLTKRLYQDTHCPCLSPLPPPSISISAVISGHPDSRLLPSESLLFVSGGSRWRMDGLTRGKVFKPAHNARRDSLTIVCLMHSYGGRHSSFTQRAE